MTYIKKLARLAIAAVLVIALAASVPTARATFDEVEEAQNSVVRVFVDVEEGIYVGTGFAVGAEGDYVSYIVTNYHVVEADPYNVYVTVSDINGGIYADIIYADVDKDFAILELEEPLEERVPITLLSPRDVHKSQDVYCIGFPLLSDMGSEELRLDSDIEAMTITKGSVSNSQHEYEGVTYVMSDVKVNGGNSGGPMVDEFGRAIGINTMVIGLQEANNMTLAISMDYIIDVLDELEIDYILDGGNNDGGDGEDGGFNFGRLALIAAGVMALIGGVTVGIVLLVKHSSKSGQNAQTPIHNGATPTYNRGTPTYNVANDETVRFRGVGVVCERGTLKGSRVTGNRIRIGRDPATCQLAFPKGTPGVSREHCEIQLLNGEIYVTDLGSTYGTFLANGERIVSQRRLGGDGLLLIGSEKVIVSVKRL